MAKEPGERYRTAGDLGRAAVAAAAAIKGSSDTRLGATQPAAPPAARARTRRLRSRASLGLAFAGLLIGASAIGLLVLTGVSDDESRNPSDPVLGDGTLLRARGSSRVYVMKAGAKFEVAPGQRAAFAYDGQGFARSQAPRSERSRASRATARSCGRIGARSSGRCAWAGVKIGRAASRRGRRHRSRRWASADSDTSGRRPTSIRLVAPPSVQEGRPSCLWRGPSLPQGSAHRGVRLLPNRPDKAQGEGEYSDPRRPLRSALEGLRLQTCPDSV